MGDRNKTSYVNKYEIDCSSLKVVDLDSYGVLSWVAEILYNREIKNSAMYEFKNEFLENYKVDTTDADIIKGYRADDSYSTVIDYFMLNKITHTELEKLLREGNLGIQYFIKSEIAFNKIVFKGYDVVTGECDSDEMLARRKVAEFLSRRESEILRDRFNGSITSLEAVVDKYIYNKEYNCYVKEGS